MGLPDTSQSPPCRLVPQLRGGVEAGDGGGAAVPRLGHGALHDQGPGLPGQDGILAATISLLKQNEDEISTMDIKY